MHGQNHIKFEADVCVALFVVATGSLWNAV